MKSEFIPKIHHISNSQGIELNNALRKMYHTQNRIFWNVFRFEGSASLRRHPELFAFEQAGILRNENGLWKSNFRIWPLTIRRKLIFISTDFFTSKNFYRIFPIYPDESDVMARHLQARQDEHMLDLCAGSGIYAIVARSQGANVVASDINSRSLEMGRLNERLNGLSGIRWIKSDLFQGHKNKRFDYIVCDPPFMPVPEFQKNSPSSSYYLHGAAGEDGFYFIKRIIDEIPLYLTKRGRFSLFVNVFGKKGELPLKDEIISSFSKRGESIHLTYHRILPGLDVLSPYHKRYRNSQKLLAWKRKISKQYDSFQLYIINGVISRSPKITRKDLSVSLPLNIREEAGKQPKRFSHAIYTNSWQYRLARFFHKI